MCYCQLCKGKNDACHTHLNASAIPLSHISQAHTHTHTVTLSVSDLPSHSHGIFTCKCDNEIRGTKEGSTKEG